MFRLAAAFDRGIVTRFLRQLKIAHRRQQTLLSFDLSLFADAMPSASIAIGDRNTCPQFFRLPFDQPGYSSTPSKIPGNAQLLSQIPISAIAGSAVADRVTVSLLDSDKELFPCACTAEAAIKHHPIANCEMPIPNLKRPIAASFSIGNLKSAIEILSYLSPSPVANPDS